ncbi:hypothetical protein SYNPS1DRAFT_22154 [Syncephalis pseudoplumigaleata]|uniref:Uncharacterized protein n=1 Tax=Syncephalis pseudoplumigaleata TaxID=1712513 RepID=A0A4P9Z0Z9_9FUNG|nr:hypothetical protein SYNPS1DRAFT_22154 [Syncephalis pseudoplumigaleata]|eukprot:RKP25988.1 hypothetical protein SYNPS1DRAFT_22154 [Syncephalis pseudoplumigaleata]
MTSRQEREHYPRNTRGSDVDPGSSGDMSAESDQRPRIIEPSVHSTGMFVNVRPGPNGYRQRRRPQQASHRHVLDDSDEAWSEEEQAAGGGIGQLLVLLAVLPAVGSLFIGTAQGWGDAVSLLAIGWFLYYVTQLPWDTYEEARLRVMVHRARNRNRARLEQLLHRERMALTATFLAPLATAWLLQQARSYLSALERVSPSSVLLYVLAASIRPILHAVALLRRRTARLRRELTWSPHEADRLRSQLADVEDQVAELRLLVLREDDMQAVREELLGKIEHAVRRVRKMARQEEQERQHVVERVATVEERVSSAEDWLEQQRAQQAQQNMLVRCVFEPVEVLKEVVHLKGDVAAPAHRDVLGSNEGDDGDAKHAHVAG